MSAFFQPSSALSEKGWKAPPPLKPEVLLKTLTSPQSFRGLRETYLDLDQAFYSYRGLRVSLKILTDPFTALEGLVRHI